MGWALPTTTWPAWPSWPAPGPTSSQLIRRAGFRLQPACAEAKAVGWLGRLTVPAPPETSWFVLPARLETVWNSQYPSGGNDGLLCGRPRLLHAGARGRGRTVGRGLGALAPEVAWQQNDWFETVPTGQGGNLAFQNPWYGDDLDVPQRFGAGPFATGRAGPELPAGGCRRRGGRRLDREPAGSAPGLRQAIVLSTNAPGFPAPVRGHLAAGGHLHRLARGAGALGAARAVAIRLDPQPPLVLGAGADLPAEVDPRPVPRRGAVGGGVVGRACSGNHYLSFLGARLRRQHPRQQPGDLGLVPVGHARGRLRALRGVGPRRHGGQRGGAAARPGADPGLGGGLPEAAARRRPAGPGPGRGDQPARHPPADVAVRAADLVHAR